MKTKFWVAIALILALLILVNIYAFGFLPDYINGKTNTDTNITTNKGSTNQAILTNGQTATTDNTASSNTQNQQTQTTNNQVITNPAPAPAPTPVTNRPVRVTRAS